MRPCVAVEIAVQADAYTLVLGLRGLEGKLALHVSWHPNAARVCLGGAQNTAETLFSSSRHWW